MVVAKAAVGPQSMRNTLSVVIGDGTQAFVQEREEVSEGASHVPALIISYGNYSAGRDRVLIASLSSSSGTLCLHEASPTMPRSGQLRGPGGVPRDHLGYGRMYYHRTRRGWDSSSQASKPRVAAVKKFARALSAA